MNNIYICIKKDCIEIIRKKKNITCSLTLLSIVLCVFFITSYYDILLEILLSKSPGMISNTIGIYEMMNKVFPKDLKGSMGIVASDIVIFYSMLSVFMTYSLIPEEINNGKWIIPLNSGFSKFDLTLSKAITYGIAFSLPTMVFYNLYYFLYSSSNTVNFPLMGAIINSLILLYLIFTIVFLTIELSIIFKKSISSALCILSIVLFAPDIFNYFSFGKWLPTYLFTHLYSSETTFTSVVTPLIMMTALNIVITYLTRRKAKEKL